MAQMLKAELELHVRRVAGRVDGYGAAIPFAVVVLVCMAYAAAGRPWLAYYDAGGYWGLAETFDRSGQADFSFLNFPAMHRGYAYPLLCYVIKRLGRLLIVGPVALLTLVNATLMALLYVVLAPALWNAMTGVRPSASRVWMAAAAGTFLWRGYLGYSLTDLPALAAFAAALVCMHRQREARGPGERALLFAGVGALGGLSTLMRPAYLLAVCALVLAASVVAWRTAGRAKLACLAALLVSLAGVAAPQVALNQHRTGSWSPLPRSEESFGSGGLYLAQLNWGLRMQRYESDISAGQHSGSVRFEDPVGTRLLAEENVEHLDTYSAYFAFALRHPIDMVAIYGRHLFNGCDVWYPTTYVDNPKSLRAGTVLVNLMVWLLVCLQCRAGASWRAVRASLPYSPLLLLPVLTAIPSAVEVRYFWPLHLLATCTAFYATPAARELALAARRHWPMLVACLCLWAMLSRSVYATMPR